MILNLLLLVVRLWRKHESRFRCGFFLFGSHLAMRIIYIWHAHNMGNGSFRLSELGYLFRRPQVLVYQSVVNAIDHIHKWQTRAKSWVNEHESEAYVGNKLDSATSFLYNLN